MIEYAASYPREAKETLSAVRTRARRLLRLKERHLLEQIEIQAEAISTPHGGAYDWDIVMSENLKKFLSERAVEIMRRELGGYYEDVMPKFKEFAKCSEQDGVDVLLINNPDGECFQVINTYTRRVLSEIYSHVPEFRKFLDVREYLRD